MKSKIFYVIGGIVLVIAILAAVGLGVWGYQLNSRLTATRKQLASLQGEYDKLKADNAQLNTNLIQTNSTLDSTKSDLAQAQSDLKAANGQVAAQRSSMDTAKNLMPVVDAMWVTTENEIAIEAKVEATGDAKLLDLWNAFIKTPNLKTVQAFDGYLFGTIATAVK